MFCSKILFFFGRDCYNIMNFFENFYSTYEFTLKEGPKVKMKKF